MALFLATNTGLVAVSDTGTTLGSLDCGVILSIASKDNVVYFGLNDGGFYVSKFDNGEFKKLSNNSSGYDEILNNSYWIDILRLQDNKLYCGDNGNTGNIFTYTINLDYSLALEHTIEDYWVSGIHPTSNKILLVGGGTLLHSYNLVDGVPTGSMGIEYTFASQSLYSIYSDSTYIYVISTSKINRFPASTLGNVSSVETKTNFTIEGVTVGDFWLHKGHMAIVNNKFYIGTYRAQGEGGVLTFDLSSGFIDSPVSFIIGALEGTSIEGYGDTSPSVYYFNNNLYVCFADYDTYWWDGWRDDAIPTPGGLFKIDPATSVVAALSLTSPTSSVIEASYYNIEEPPPAGNAAPADISLSSLSISENNYSGALIGTLSTTDPDVGDTFTYTLVSGDISAFSISQNKLLAAQSFDYETKSSYAITIRSTDQGGLYFEKEFAIAVVDINELPTSITESPTIETGLTQIGSPSTSASIQAAVTIPANATVQLLKSTSTDPISIQSNITVQNQGNVTIAGGTWKDVTMGSSSVITIAPGASITVGNKTTTVKRGTLLKIKKK